MHQSFFEYPISKPYPFRWFTPLVVVGGLILAAVATVLTLATSGYDLQPFSTDNPNATVAQKKWFNKAPLAWGGSVEPTCQVQQLPIGSTLFTSNLGMTYQLTSVAKLDDEDQFLEARASLPYLNQTLQDCKVVDVQLWFRKADLSQDGNGLWYSWDDGYAVSRANCTISTPEGKYVADLSTTYNPPQRDFSYVIRNNLTTSTSMWWATRLLNAYYSSILTAISQMPTGNPDSIPNPIWTRGQMGFTTNNTDDIQSYDIFSLDYFFLASDAGIKNEVSKPVGSMYNNYSIPQSAALTQGLTFARTMYSAILVDLGQPQYSNLLLNSSLLEWTLAHPNDTFRNTFGNILNCSSVSCWYESVRYNTLAGPDNIDNSYGSSDDDNSPRHERVSMLDAYTTFKPADSGVGSLGTKNTTIYTQYQCSVPTRKDTGALALLALIAIFVWLQASWTFLNLVSKQVVALRDPVGANTCTTTACAASDPMKSSLLPGGGSGSGIYDDPRSDFGFRLLSTNRPQRNPSFFSR